MPTTGADRIVGRRKLARATLAFVLLLGVVIALPAGADHGDPATIDFEVTPGVYTAQMRDRGVTFPQGVEVFTCNTPDCGTSGTARSGTNAARTEGFEFTLEPFEARFESLQHTVQIYVRYRGRGSADQNIQATMRGYDNDNEVVGTNTITFAQTATWQPLTLFRCFRDVIGGGTSCIDDIRRVVVTARFSGETFDSNWLVYDDLTFDIPSTGVTTPPPDTVSPTITILDPTDLETETDRVLDVSVRVEDDRDLQRVTGEVIDASAGSVVSETPFCGTSDTDGGGRTDACPIGPPSPVVFQRSQQALIPESAENGQYIFRVHACDGSNNCSSRDQRFILDVPPPEVARQIVASRVEVNQGIQNVLSMVEGPGHLWPLSTGVQLVPGKDTVVRYYLFGIDGEARDYTAALQLRGERRDGSSFGGRIQPNAGGPIDVRLQPDAADLRETLLSMRTDPTTTLNFVIPAATLNDVSFLELQLRKPDGSPVTGWGQARLSPPLRIGLNVIKIKGPMVDEGRPPGPIETNILNYMRAAYPVTEVTVVSEFSKTLLPINPVVAVWSLFDECSSILFALWTVAGGDDAPVRRFSSDPHVTPTMGIVPYDSMDGALGCGYVGGAPVGSTRVGGTLVTEAWGDTASHEVGHTLGLEHASNVHDEGDGGDVEADWPYPHGTIGNDSFGVIPEAQTPPTGTSYGQWQVNVIDPCSPVPVDQRLSACPVDDENDDEIVHELMSYGDSNTDLSPLVTSKGRWISPRTYSRIHTKICGRACGSSESSARTMTAAPADSPNPNPPNLADYDRVESLLFDAVVKDDGTLELFPLIRKPMPRSLVQREDTGPYTVELRSSGGEVLYRRSVALGEIASEGGRHFDVIHEVLPYRKGTAQVVVQHSGDVVATKTASPTAPDVSIVEPTGGQTLASGTHAIRWEASDSDGDPVWSLVQYSPDGGWSWQGIALVPPGAVQEAELVVADMIPGRSGIIRVTASDEFNTTIAQSEFISVGTTDDPADDARARRRMSFRLRKHLRATGRVRAPEGPASCTEFARVVITRNGKKVAETRTDLVGRYKVRLHDRRGRYRAVAKPEERGLIDCLTVRSATARHGH